MIAPEMEDDEIASYLSRYVQKEGYAWGLKGIPSDNKGVFTDDKHREEEIVTLNVLQHLREHGVKLRSEPEGRDLPPDVAIKLASGARIGFEVRELVDHDMRAQHARRRRAERKEGISPLSALRAESAAFKDAQKAAGTARSSGGDPGEAFWSVYRSKHPTPDCILPFAVAAWDAKKLASAIDSITELKEDKVRPFVKKYREIWLAMFTDEMMITRELILIAAGMLRYRPTLMNRIFIVLRHDPAQVMEIQNGGSAKGQGVSQLVC
jgi:hypothetical protein